MEVYNKYTDRNEFTHIIDSQYDLMGKTFAERFPSEKVEQLFIEMNSSY